VVITITLHPFSKTSAGQESSSEAKAVAPRKQTLHMLSSQTLSDLRDVVVCSATQIPVCSHDGNQWLDQRWISGSAFIIQNVLFADTRPIPSPLDDHSAGKSDYGLLSVYCSIIPLGHLFIYLFIYFFDMSFYLFQQATPGIITRFNCERQSRESFNDR
jgi:hypothetical protein